MITLYAWKTPNNGKILIFLEEAKLDYSIEWINIGASEQFGEDFLKISPNGKVPAIVDHHGQTGEPLSLFESGAILIYLAEKTGRFIPVGSLPRQRTFQWLMFQMSGLGPIIGQMHHFEVFSTEKVPYAIERFRNEALRLYEVLDKHLSKNEYIVGSDYSIADMATFPSIEGNRVFTPSEFPNIKRWHAQIKERKAVQKTLEILASGLPQKPAPKKSAKKSAK